MKIYIALLALILGACCHKPTSSPKHEAIYIINRSYLNNEKHYDVERIGKELFSHPLVNKPIISSRPGVMVFGDEMSIYIYEVLMETEQHEEFNQWMLEHHNATGVSQGIETIKGNIQPVE